MPAHPPRHSPLRKNSDLSKASGDQLQEQLRYELWQVKESRPYSNEALAHDLDYKDGASISQWLNGHAPLPEKCCKNLDGLKHKPSVGNSFTELHQAYVRARRKSGPRSEKSPQMYDVFLASPMASLQGKQAYSTERRAARELKEALENSLNFTVYYAGESLEAEEEFDSALTAAERNFHALHSSRYFLLLSVGKAEKPSSVTVEAGYALARGIPSLYLVRHVEYLPFVLRSLGQHEYPELPRVMIETIDRRERAVRLIQKHGEKIFGRLHEPVRREGVKEGSRRRKKPSSGD